ncbi:MAG: transposon-encoded TnpW family protein [Lachnospirales bacterium]
MYKKIGVTTYVVNVHFSEKSTETINDKIERMI